MIHLDTSFIILALAPGSAEDRKLRKWLQNRESLAMSAIAWAEILCGPLPLELVQVAARIVPERVPFDDVDAELAAQLFSDSRRRGGTFVDCMIAASALRAGAQLATSNVADFRRFASAGLSLVVD